MCDMSRGKDISVLMALTAALAATPAAAAPRPVDSWGRAGVAYETYRNDSLECGLLGHYADVSRTEQARLFARASRQLETIDSTSYAGSSVPAAAAAMGGGGSQGGIVAPDTSTAAAPSGGVEQARRYEQVRRGIRPEKRMQELKEGMVGVVEDCLRERGYVQFRLTDEQREMLSHLSRGSEERREFLYRLASDADILSAQQLPAAAS